MKTISRRNFVSDRRAAAMDLLASLSVHSGADQSEIHSRNFGSGHSGL